MTIPRTSRRWFWIGFGLLGLLLVFVFQRVDYLSIFTVGEAQRNLEASFVVNRAVRLILNDALCLLLIANIFQRADYNRLAWRVFLVELLLVLPIYLFVKLKLEGPTEISSPLLQPIHRMIVNPLLMIILMGALYFQRWKLGKR